MNSRQRFKRVFDDKGNGINAQDARFATKLAAQREEP